VAKGNHKGPAPEFVFCRAVFHISRMPLIFSQIRAFVTVGAAALVLAGCDRMNEIGFDTKMAVGSVSLVDRCSDFMHRAYPDAPIDVSSSHVDTDSENVTVTVAGIRSGVPASGAYARTVAVECRFEGGILSGFRWLAGPVRSATTGQAP
jgi:hypothetical protein